MLGLASFEVFVKHIRVLVGTGRACFETLRPLAYSLLAEIVHHVRANLSLSQVFHFLTCCFGWTSINDVFLLFNMLI